MFLLAMTLPDVSTKAINDSYIADGEITEAPATEGP